MNTNDTSWTPVKPSAIKRSNQVDISKQSLDVAYRAESLNLFKKTAALLFVIMMVAMTSAVAVSFFLASSKPNTSLYYLYHALSYEIRYISNRESVAMPQMTIHGKINNATVKDDVFWVKIHYKNNEGTPSYGWFNLANFDVYPNAKEKAVEFIRNNRGPFQIEIYFGEKEQHALIYESTKVLNIRMIEEGLGEPSKRPITRQVDKIFADYFWREMSLHHNKD